MSPVEEQSVWGGGVVREPGSRGALCGASVPWQRSFKNGMSAFFKFHKYISFFFIHSKVFL